MSTPVMASTPSTHTPTPAQARPGSRSPRNQPMIPAQIGCVHTSAAEEATVV